MRVAVHDYAGHPFQVELSRELARRGHDVLHLYSSSITTPRGPIHRLPGDPETFTVEPVELRDKIDRDRLFSRRRLEREHGRLAVERLLAFKPEVVLSANTPLDAQRRISTYCSANDVGFAYWVQDLIGEATKRLLRRRSAFTIPVAWHYKRLERKLLWGADAVVVISEDFRPYVPPTAAVIENWAPLKDLPLMPKGNDWSTEHGLANSTNVLYSGTLGMKHDPQLLVRLAGACAEIESTRVVVASEGRAADWLREQSAVLRPQNLVVLPFQPFEGLAEMHAAADVLVAILEPDAGTFSVPSKVLTYLCAGKPLLLVVPPENLAARIVTEIGAGVVVAPDCGPAIERALVDLLADPAARAKMGRQARAYAERTFDLSAITDRFEAILEKARDLKRVRAAPQSACVQR